MQDQRYRDDRSHSQNRSRSPNDLSVNASAIHRQIPEPKQVTIQNVDVSQTSRDYSNPRQSNSLAQNQANHQAYPNITNEMWDTSKHNYALTMPQVKNEAQHSQTKSSLRKSPRSRDQYNNNMPLRYSPPKTTTNDVMNKTQQTKINRIPITNSQVTTNYSSNIRQQNGSSLRSDHPMQRDVSQENIRQNAHNPTVDVQGSRQHRDTSREDQKSNSPLRLVKSNFVDDLKKELAIDRQKLEQASIDHSQIMSQRNYDQRQSRSPMTRDHQVYERTRDLDGYNPQQQQQQQQQRNQNYQDDHLHTSYYQQAPLTERNLPRRSSNSFLSQQQVDYNCRRTTDRSRSPINDTDQFHQRNVQQRHPNFMAEEQRRQPVASQVLQNYNQEQSMIHRNRDLPLQMMMSTAAPPSVQSSRQYNQQSRLEVSDLQNQREKQSLKHSLEQAMDLQNYYQKMAEDYRAKYLALEREYNFYQHTQAYDLERSVNELNALETRMQERINFEQEEAERKLNELKSETQSQIDVLQADNDTLRDGLLEQQKHNDDLIDKASKKERENQLLVRDVESMQTTSTNQIEKLQHELDYAKQQNKRDLENMKKDQEQNEERTQKRHQQEIESIKQDADQAKTKSENELKNQIESLENDIKRLSTDIEIQKKKSDDVDQTLHEQKTENKLMVENLDRERQAQQLTITELAVLREERVDLTKKLEKAMRDVKGYKDDIEQEYKIKKQLKNKMKNMEKLVYGKQQK